MINKIILILFVISILLIIVSVNKETFEINEPKERMLYAILPTIDNEYLATFLPENSDANNSNIIKTISLESNEWDGPLINSIPNDTIAGYSQPFIVDLTYNKDTRLIGIAQFRKINEIKYRIYIKENTDLESNWIYIPSRNDINIRSIIYDYNSNLIGCKDDGQLYIIENVKEFPSVLEWKGPINWDLPVRKVLFDKDGKMLGIGMFDDLIYKKLELDWTKSKWDKNHKGFDEVFDVYGQ